ncbi:MAG TPA: DsrE family protein [Coriobacteriia bacterium]
MAGEKLGFLVTHAADDPEVATLPFMIATAAMTMGVEPVVIFQGEGVRLGVKGFAETIHADGLQPLESLLAPILEAGHEIMVCSPCVKLRGIEEADLRDGVYVGGAGKIVQQMLECKNFVRY